MTGATTIVLAESADTLELVTSAAASLEVNVTYIDASDPAGPAPGGAKKQNTVIHSVTTTAILAASAEGMRRHVKQIIVRNNDPVASNDVTLRFSRNAASSELQKQTLLPGAALVYIEGVGFDVSKPSSGSDGAIATARSRPARADTEDTAIYRKTAKGTREIVDRTFGLESQVRRLLIMVDGSRNVAELSVYVRAGELKSTLTRLLTEGFVEMVSAGERAPGRVAYAPAADDPAVFAGIKLKAMADIRRLGPASNEVLSEIADCSDALELRQKLRDIEKALIRLLGETEGVAFARKIGRELTRLVRQTP